MPPALTVSRAGGGPGGGPAGGPGGGPGGAFGAKVVRKLPLKTLMPIEDTIRQRGGLLQQAPLQRAASAPGLPRVGAGADAGAAAAAAAPRVELPSAAVQDTDEFVAWYRQREVSLRNVQDCGFWATAAAGPGGPDRAAALAGKAQAHGWTRVRHVSGAPSGLGALVPALLARCSTLEEAFVSLGGAADAGAAALGGLTVLRFAGGLALLGLEARAVCGCDEAEAFRRLDADGDGLVGVQDLLAAGARAAEAPADVPADVPGAGGAMASPRWLWWLAAGRYVALSAWFCTPPPLRRRGRGGGRGGGEEETPRAQSPPGMRPGGARAGSPVRPGSCPGESEALARQQSLDALRRRWSPQEDHLALAERRVLEEFRAHATARQFGERLLSRADLLRLCGGFPLAALADDPAAAGRVTQAEVCQIFDDVLEWQAERAPLPGGRGPVTKGLTFASLRLVLLKVALAAGLHFRHLVDDALDALAGPPGPRA